MMKIKRRIAAILSIFMVLACTACSGGLQQDTEVTEPQDAETQQGDVTVSQEPTESETVETPENDESKVLIAYFSRTGENYNVGVIEKGNTHIVADMIAEETGGNTFEIRTVTPYPDDYDACTEIAKQEQDENARPELAESVEDIERYDVIFLGYPNWWGDMPMAVYTFLESYDFSGKTIVPFCTHEGSGLSSTESSIANSCPDAEVLDGLAIRGSVAQNSQDEAKEAVVSWLAEMESEGLLSLGNASAAIEITMTAGNTVITAELSDSETTRAFLETLPRTFTMNRYNDREYYSRMEAITENGESIEDFENGDVTYYPAGPSLAIFFDKEDTSDQAGLIRMGKITSELSAFDSLGDSVEIYIEVQSE